MGAIPLLSLFTVLLFSVCTVPALPWDGAAQTVHGISTLGEQAGWTPKPTSKHTKPNPLGRAISVVPASVCGWEDGNPLGKQMNALASGPLSEDFTQISMH